MIFSKILTVQDASIVQTETGEDQSWYQSSQREDEVICSLSYHHTEYKDIHKDDETVNLDGTRIQCNIIVKLNEKHHQWNQVSESCYHEEEWEAINSKQDVHKSCDGSS